ncbi:MAG: PepSY-associated TM helix domain-containing protein [Bacteroidota bacterium]
MGARPMAPPAGKPVGARPTVPPPSRPAKKKREHWRKTMFRIHGWLGLNVGLLLFVICFSGSVATISNEIDWLLNADARVAAADAPYDWDAMHETLQNTFPDARVSGLYVSGSMGTMASAGKRMAALAYVSLPEGGTRKVYLNPYTGELQANTNFFNVQRFFRTFHRRLFDGARGIFIVTLWSLFLLAATISGFVFYKGWVRQLFTLRLSKGLRLRWSDLHKTLSAWALLFSFLIAVTGFFYLVEVIFQRADNYSALLPPPLPQVDEAELPDAGSHVALLPPSAYIQAAEAAYPGLRIQGLRMPTDPGRAVYVDGQAGNILTRDRADKVHLHPATADVLGIQKTSDLDATPFITDAVDPLHFGYFGGLATKLLWFVLGLVLSFSILSGTYLWLIRTEGKKRGTTSKWLRGAPVAALITLAYLAVVTFATADGIQVYAPSNRVPTPIAERTVGPYDVRIDCVSPCDTGTGARMAVRFLGEALPNYADAQITVSDGEVHDLRGSSIRPTATVEASQGEALTLRVTMHDGAVHEAAFTPAMLAPLPPAARWPDAIPGVYVVVVLFIVATVGSIVLWMVLVVRALRKATLMTAVA